jgi:hypothetical protein
MTARKRNRRAARAAPRPQLGQVFVLRLQSRRSDDGIRALRSILKTLLRAHAWRCLSVEPEARR